ncbi:MAG TPA: hypothetical protein VK753_01860, partial [Xanthomonadaceae bacterium]|nr:hypothetical protein [Xanthomonadaceae bacterium]
MSGFVSPLEPSNRLAPFRRRTLTENGSTFFSAEESAVSPHTHDRSFAFNWPVGIPEAFFWTPPSAARES